jgi:hypothetical protein
MKHAVSVLAVLVAFTAGCSGEPSGPVEIARMYDIESADGETIPVRAFRTISNDAGTCVYDLMGGALTFNPKASGYGVSFSYVVRCAGTGESWSHDTHSGMYTRSGDELSFTPRT